MNWEKEKNARAQPYICARIVHIVLVIMTDFNMHRDINSEEERKRERIFFRDMHIVRGKNLDGSRCSLRV